MPEPSTTHDVETGTAVRVRFFASARAAVGVSTTTVHLPAGSSIDALLDDIVATPIAATSSGSSQSSGQLERVLSRCSFLVNTVATTDRSTVLRDGDLVDVMPPFAGG